VPVGSWRATFPDGPHPRGQPGPSRRARTTWPRLSTSGNRAGKLPRQITPFGGGRNPNGCHCQLDSGAMLPQEERGWVVEAGEVRHAGARGRGCPALQPSRPSCRERRSAAVASGAEAESLPIRWSGQRSHQARPAPVGGNPSPKPHPPTIATAGRSGSRQTCRANHLCEDYKVR
jgi:hypothetical protein